MNEPNIYHAKSGDWEVAIVAHSTEEALSYAMGTTPVLDLLTVERVDPRRYYEFGPSLKARACEMARKAPTVPAVVWRGRNAWS